MKAKKRRGRQGRRAGAGRGKKENKWKRYLVNGGILAAVFLIAVIIFSYTTNKENNNIAADLGAATRPQVSFTYKGNVINPLPVYAKEMDMTAVRGTVTPVENGRLEMNLDLHNNTAVSLVYGVYTLDGADKLWENELMKPGESVSLTFDNMDLLSEERMLKISLTLREDKEEKEDYLYTRIVDSAQMGTSECLAYIRSFRENALGKVEDAGVGMVLEPNEESDNTTFQHVTIHSDFDHVSWGNLEPQVEGSEQVSIMEMSSMYTSVLFEYQVRCKGEEDENDIYNVREFFRARHIREGGDDYLLDYDRTMEQVFDASHTIMDDRGLILGIADGDVSCISNKEGTIVSFVQAGELWNYNKNTDEISLVFSFADAENTDARNLLSQHEIRLLGMEENGNTAFAVYGYMNRGEHEGYAGAVIYYYEPEKNAVEEKMFISSDKSYERIADELGELMYYSVEQDMLYVLADGTFYEINAGMQNMSELVTGLSETQYVVADDGHIAAYQTEETKMTVKNFANGKERTVECEKGENIVPLGFVNDDFIYGLSRDGDAGKTVAGQAVFPMYKVVIEDEKGETIKKYEQPGIYILGAVLDAHLITLKLAEKEGTSYNSTSEEYITNNEGKDDSRIYAETYATELKETQVRLVLNEQPEDRSPKLLKPKQTVRDNLRIVDFTSAEPKNKCYVYGRGRLQGSYDRAGDAIKAADSCSGVVVSAWQSYIWQRGNRDLQYSIEGKDKEVETMLSQLKSGKAPMDIMQEISPGRELDLTGCEPEQVLYIVNQDIPVIAMLDAKNAVVITGYGDGTIAYKDGGKGTKVVTYKEMEEMTKGSGNTYVAYLGTGHFSP